MSNVNYQGFIMSEKAANQLKNMEHGKILHVSEDGTIYAERTEKDAKRVIEELFNATQT